MAKLISVFLCCFMLLALPACKNKNIEKSSDIENTFESNVKINYGKNEYECELSHTPEHVNIVKILKPDNLRGLTFSWEDGVCEVSWHDLKCEFSKNILPDSSFISGIIDALNTISSSDSLEACSGEGDYKIFKGNCEAGNFQISVDKNGNIKNLSVPEKGIDAEFSAIDS